MNTEVKFLLDNMSEFLKQDFGIKINWEIKNDKTSDGEISFIINDRISHFRFQFKKELRYYQVKQLKDYNSTIENYMLVAEKIYPKVKKQLIELQIPFFEYPGNLYIENENNFILIDQQKRETQPLIKKANRAFSKSGIILLFHLLSNDNLIEQNQREIAKLTNISLGNISNILRNLEEQGFIIKNGKKRLITDKEKLIEKWVSAFNEKLKPALFMGKYRFVNTDNYEKWHEIKLPENTYWGGEPAGDILTNHLRPGEWTLYTKLSPRELMKNIKLISDSKGDVVVYDVLGEQYDNKSTPPLLTYADLLLTNNKRCIETAQIIYEKHIK
jgi:hypothetical protein